MRFEKIRQHPFWSILGVLLGLFFAFFIYRFIGTFVFGIFFYYVSRPFYRRVKQHIEYRGLAAGISLLVVMLPLFILFSWLSMAALQEYRLINEQLDIASQLEPYVGPFIDLTAATNGNFSSLTGSIDAVQTTLDVMLQYVSIFGIGATHLFLMIIIAFYLLRDDHKLSAWLRSFDNDNEYLTRYIKVVDQDLHHIFFGNILNAVIAGTIASLLYLSLNTIAPAGVNVPYPVLIGSLVGVASLIPIVGMKIAYLPIAGYLYVTTTLLPSEPAFWFPTTFLVGSFILVDGIPDFILRPYVSGKNTHIGMLMGAYILGPFMFGYYGIFLAPMLLVLVLQYSRIILPELLEADNLQLLDSIELDGKTTTENNDPSKLDDEPPNQETEENTIPKKEQTTEETTSE